MLMISSIEIYQNYIYFIRRYERECLPFSVIIIKKAQNIKCIGLFFVGVLLMMEKCHISLYRDNKDERET